MQHEPGGDPTQGTKTSAQSALVVRMVRRQVTGGPEMDGHTESNEPTNAASGCSVGLERAQGFVRAHEGKLI